MADPQEMRIPDHVPDELVEAYGTAALERRHAAGPPAALVHLRASARSDTRLIGVALTCCVAVGTAGVDLAALTMARDITGRQETAAAQSRVRALYAEDS